MVSVLYTDFLFSDFFNLKFMHSKMLSTNAVTHIKCANGDGANNFIINSVMSTGLIGNLLPRSLEDNLYQKWKELLQ